METSLYTIFGQFLGIGGKRGFMGIPQSSRQVAVMREDEDTIGIFYRSTRLLTLWSDGVVGITMGGWYTQNSIDILNALLPEAVRVASWTPTNAHPMHSYVYVVVNPNTRGAAWSPLLEGTAGEGVLVHNNNNVWEIDSPATIEDIILRNNDVDDLIDAYLSRLAGILVSPDDWYMLAKDFHQTIGVPYAFMPSEALRMMRDGVLDIQILAAALRYDKDTQWYMVGADIIGRQDIRELRNSMRVFLLWFCLTGPLVLRRGGHARPLSGDTSIQFPA